ncbi:hypothetical protein ACHMWU_26165 [Aeromicrobium sp. UC242_57]
MSPDGLSRTPLTWADYLADVLPAILPEAGLTSDSVLAIIKDVGSRAQGYAAGGRSARRALRTPFLDDVVDFNPAEAPLPVRADVAVVVRNSILEDQHAAGLVVDNHLAEATHLACAPLNTWLREHSNSSEHDPPSGPFSAMVDFPRAYAALQALALAAEAGGRRAFRSPVGAVVPKLPTAHQGEVERTATGFVRRSAISDLDQGLVQILRGVADGEIDCLFVSLSRDIAVTAFFWLRLLK